MKNIILCSDGTGNRGGKTRGTNVWRIFNAVDRDNNKIKQITFYDDGVGTDNWRWLKLFGGAFGWGLSRNIRELYSFLVMNYKESEKDTDKVFLFGFSRGAYTVRSLAGMICKCGLLDRKKYINHPKRKKLIKRILRAYRRDCTDWLEKLENELKDENSDKKPFQDIKIEFMGVWDTVDAVGIPFDKCRKYLDKIYKLFTRHRLYSFRDQHLSPKVSHGYQALAIDDERTTFHPNIWKPDNNVEQVWFAGAHSNVGGGYPKDGMAQVTLEWMMEKAENHGLKLSEHDKKECSRHSDVHSKLYDSRSGAAAYYRYSPREINKNPKVHASVYDRIIRGTEKYAPFIIPENAELAFSAKGNYSNKLKIKKPVLDQDIVNKVKSMVNRRKWLYRIFVTFNLVVAALLIWVMLKQGSNAGSAIASTPQNFFDTILCKLQQFVQIFVPGFFERFVGVVFNYPYWSSFFIAVFIFLRRCSTKLKRKINETAFFGWQDVVGGDSAEVTEAVRGDDSVKEKAKYKIKSKGK